MGYQNKQILSVFLWLPNLSVDIKVSLITILKMETAKIFHVDGTYKC